VCWQRRSSFGEFHAKGIFFSSGPKSGSARGVSRKPKSSRSSEGSTRSSPSSFRVHITSTSTVILIGLRQDILDLDMVTFVNSIGERAFQVTIKHYVVS